MRIGHIAAGIWRSVHLDMSKALQRAGHQVCVFTEDARAPSARRFTRSTEDGVEIWVINNERRNTMWWVLDRMLKSLLGRRFFTVMDALNRYITDSQCAAYMVEGDALGLSLALLNYLRPLRWVVCVHDHEYLGIHFGYIGEPSDRTREKIKHWVLQRATLIRANSHVTKQVLVRAGIDANKVEVVPLHWIPRMIVNGDLATYRESARNEILSRHALPPTCDLLLASCRLTPFKGLELAIQALPHVARERANVKLMICGADRRIAGVGSYKALLERAAVEVGVSGRVLFTGDVPTENMKAYYAAADVHVAPSYLDTFNYSALEAALAGTASVVTDAVGSGPWLAECNAALIVPGRDAAMFAAAVLKTLNERSATSAAAMSECVREALSPQKVASKLGPVLERAASTR
jgi:glycosyltransferase involved in cell wall biosynthesis